MPSPPRCAEDSNMTVSEQKMLADELLTALEALIPGYQQYLYIAEEHGNDVTDDAAKFSAALAIIAKAGGRVNEQ